MASLTWLGHASFRLDTDDGTRVYVDPWVSGPTCPEAEKEPERAMIFCRTQIAVDRLMRILTRDGFAVEAIHGSMGQRQRERVISDFRRGVVKYLVATNLAARGLDIPEVSHVINYDIPDESESYVHRIGRTARMGREGMAITFVAEWDEKPLAEIKKVVNGALREERLGIYA